MSEDGVVFDMLTYVGACVPQEMRVYVLGTLSMKTLIKMYSYMMCTVPTRDNADAHDSESFVRHLVDITDAIENNGFTIKIDAVRSR